MAGLDKILEHIKNDAESEVKSIIAEAEKEAAEIIADAKAEGAKEADALKAQANAGYEDALKRGESAADLKAKRMVLEAKQEIIESVITNAKDSVLKASDNEYFDTIISMVKKYAINEDGVIIFNKADKSRMPRGFEKDINKALKDKGVKLSVSDDTKAIDGGFILEYGDIEENCSFEALFAAAKESLQDKVGALLF